MTFEKFIDNLFRSILTVDSTLPAAVKYLYDFFDSAAERHGFTDPNVVHAWKSNRSTYVFIFIAKGVPTCATKCCMRHKHGGAKHSAIWVCQRRRTRLVRLRCQTRVQRQLHCT